jgi:starch phosphorylase
MLLLDGWWIEGCIEGVTGRSIGPNRNENVSNDERRRRKIDDLW